MSPSYDVAIVGLGIVGSAVAYTLSKSGLRVLGIERFARGKERGSSFGETRLFRSVRLEDEVYSPLMARARAAWGEVQSDSATPLYRRLPTYFVGAEGSPLIDAARRQYPESRLPGTLDLDLPPNTKAVFDPEAGVFDVASCLDALRQSAEHRGAELMFSTTAHAAGNEIIVHGAPVVAKKTIITAGPWIGRYAPMLRPYLRIESVPQAWFRTDADWPLVLWDSPMGTYGLCPSPRLGGIRVFPRDGQRTEDPDGATTSYAALNEFVRACVPGARGPAYQVGTSFYTRTEDDRFIIDWMAPDQLIVSACCSRGFQLAPVIAEQVARVVLDGAPPPAAFRWSRFQEVSCSS